MSAIMVRYKVKPDRVDENVESVTAVFEALNREEPPGFRYASFQLEDGVSFVHIVLEQASGFNLQEFEPFQRFVEGVGERCDEPPVATGMTEIGSYKF